MPVLACQNYDCWAHAERVDPLDVEELPTSCLQACEEWDAHRGNRIVPQTWNPA